MINEYLVNDTTRIWKEAGVSLADFNTIVAMFNQELGPTRVNLGDPQKTDFATNITTVRVGKSGVGISYQNNILFVGCDETNMTIFPYLFTENILSSG